MTKDNSFKHYEQPLTVSVGIKTLCMW